MCSRAVVSKMEYADNYKVASARAGSGQGQQTKVKKHGHLVVRLEQFCCPQQVILLPRPFALHCSLRFLTEDIRNDHMIICILVSFGFDCCSFHSPFSFHSYSIPTELMTPQQGLALLEIYGTLYKYGNRPTLHVFKVVCL